VRPHEQGKISWRGEREAWHGEMKLRNIWVLITRVLAFKGVHPWIIGFNCIFINSNGAASLIDFSKKVMD